MLSRAGLSGIIRTFWGLLKQAYRDFRSNDPLRMAAATSFFASFALPPVMIILVELLGLFADPRSIRRDLFRELSAVMNEDIALQVRMILRNIHFLSLNGGMRAAGFIFLLFVATTLFEIIKDSLNQIWKIKRKPHVGIGAVLLYRLRSIVLIVLAGLLFSLSLLADALVGALPEGGRGFFYHGITFVAIVVWFVLLFKYLAEGRPSWKTAIAGGGFTALLFTFGEVVLHFVFSYNKAHVIYGASTAMVLLLLFIFYCSFIFYFGACFTRALEGRVDGVSNQ